MKLLALITYGATMVVFLAPAGQATMPKRLPHLRPHVHLSGVASAGMKKTATTTTAPMDVNPVATETVQANDPTAVDCTYMVCGDANGGAGEDAAAAPLAGSTSVTPTPATAVSQFCADNSYMC
jgi:hypothetical protein